MGGYRERKSCLFYLILFTFVQIANCKLQIIMYGVFVFFESEVSLWWWLFCFFLFCCRCYCHSS